MADIKRLEDQEGVNTAPAADSVAAGAGSGAAEKESSGQLYFDVMLLDAGPNRDLVIKLIRELTGLGSKDAERLIDSLPKLVKSQIPKADAEEIKDKFVEAGASATIQ